MRINLTLGLQTGLLLLAMAVVLAGCSRINLAYRNLDLLVAWSLDDYLDLNRQQQARLRERLREHLAWHCRTQLPDDLDALQRVRQQIRQGELDERAIRSHYEDIRQAIQSVAVEITPTTVQLLRELDERQVSQLAEALARDHQEHLEKYLAAPLPQQIRERDERKGVRVDQWLGKLDDAQRQRILGWDTSHGYIERICLGVRRD